MMLRRQPPTLTPASPWSDLHDLGYRELADQLADQLDRAATSGLLTDVEVARVIHLIRLAVHQEPQSPGTVERQLHQLRAALGATPPAGLARARNLSERRAVHHVGGGAVRLGHIPPDPRNPRQYHGQDRWLNTDILRTSALVIGPPGSGKTYSFATPIAECLQLASLVGTASFVALDVKGDDLERDGAFDITIDLRHPTRGSALALYGGTTDPDVAADQLGSALIPADPTADHQYFHDAARNALYDALAPYYAAHDRFPTIRQLLDVLRRDPATIQSLTDRLKNRHRDTELRRLEDRAQQLGRRDDAAASLIERLRQLDRPHLAALLDRPGPKFSMHQINQPIRVRVALDEGAHPEASRMIARLIISQFVHTVSAEDTNTTIYKGLLIDEAGRFIDDYTARGIQRLRSRNAGLILLTQTLTDIPLPVRGTILGSTGTKAVFGGLTPDDATYFSDSFGTHTALETTYNTGTQTGHTQPGTFGAPPGHNHGQTEGTTLSYIEKPLWSPSDLIHLPTGHTVITTTTTTGHRTPPTLVNLRHHYPHPH